MAPTTIDTYICGDLISADVPFHDVKPPAGVLTCALEAVRLTLSISRTRKRKRRKVEACAKKVDASPGNEAISNIYQSDDNLFSPDANESISGDFDDLLLEDESQQIFTTCQQGAEDAGNENTCQPARVPKRPSSIYEPVADDDTKLDSEAVTRLVDAALQLAVCNRTARLGRGMRVTNNETLVHLADVAPSIWSPGYLPAMSDRAVFLPTISHALLNVASTQAGSASLRAKVDTLTTTSVQVPIATGIIRGPEERMAVRLWKLLQAGLYDENTLKLTPLPCTTAASRGMFEGDRFDTLDVSQDSQDALDWADFSADYDNYGSANLDEDDLLDLMMDDCSAMNEGEMESESEDTPWAEDNCLELLPIEPSGTPSNLVHANKGLGQMKDSNVLARLHEGESEDEEDLLSICGSIGPLSRTRGV
ncbi:hypothetical protein LTR08_003358 [Meristemomyces frigidus]|nr:hypothetical protein LTR08_003358 [Meristemomyces frigidus]